jgi:hypothetical protein
VLSGAVFVRSLSVRSSAAPVDEPLLIRAARVLRVIAQAHRLGKGVSESELGDQVSLNAQQHQRVFAALGELKLIGVNAQRQWTLGRDLQAVNLWQLYQLLPEEVNEAALNEIDDFPRLTQLLSDVGRYNLQQLSASIEEVL